MWSILRGHLAHPEPLSSCGAIFARSKRIVLRLVARQLADACSALIVQVGKSKRGNPTCMQRYWTLGSYANVCSSTHFRAPKSKSLSKPRTIQQDKLYVPLVHPPVRISRWIGYGWSPPAEIWNRWRGSPGCDLVPTGAQRTKKPPKRSDAPQAISFAHESRAAGGSP